MDITLILIIIGVLLGVYIIFKFIKKLVFAIITTILLIGIVIGSVFGIVYLDFKQLSSSTDFNVDVIYLNSNNYEFGTKIMFKNNSKIDLNSIKGISGTELQSIDAKNIVKDDNLYVIEIDNKLFDSLIANKTFNFDQFKTNKAFSSFKLELTGKEISTILNSKNAQNDFIKLILDKNNYQGQVRAAISPIIKSEIGKLPFKIKEILFLAVMQESLKDQANIIKLLKAYKNDNGVNVYPDRYTFKMLRMLPISTIESYIPTNPLK